MHPGSLPTSMNGKEANPMNSLSKTFELSDQIKSDYKARNDLRSQQILKGCIEHDNLRVNALFRVFSTNEKLLAHS